MTTRRGQAGFSLGETMLAILIMAIVGLIVTGGISTAANTYRKIVEKSNAELLLATTVTELRAELDRAEEISLSGTTLSRYRSSTSGWRSLESVTAPDAVRTYPGIWVTEYKGYDRAATQTHAPQPLVTKAAASKELYAKFDSITFDKDAGVFTIKNLQVFRYTDGADAVPLAKISDEAQTEYYIRSLEHPRLYADS